VRHAAVSLALLVSGCLAENPASLTDTTGADIGWDCSRGSCTTVRDATSASVPSMCGAATDLLVGAGALAILCAVSVGPDGADVVHERTCRPIACADELDCPQWEERAYTCLASICQYEALALDRVDVSALCLYDVPRHESCAAAEEDALADERMAAVDAACADGTCTIPEGCLVP
jgi:hypothetical protein